MDIINTNPKASGSSGVWHAMTGIMDSQSVLFFPHFLLFLHAFVGRSSYACVDYNVFQFEENVVPFIG